MTLFPDLDETIGDMLAAMANGSLTSAAIVERCLARIDQQDGELRAWIRVDSDGALQQARRLDRERAAGAICGVLYGIPIGIKDLIDVQGTVTAAGSKRRATGEPATGDAELVAALRAAGAIILGKTVTTQFACFDPPPTRNPWNAGHTPGGSSSGSAAGVAAGMVPAAIGSQTGGSITRPAAFCGVAGCKPTFGTVSLEGVVPVAASLDHPGPIARCVRDLALVLAALRRESSGTVDLSRFERRPPRIGRLRGFSEDRVEPVMRQALDRALDQLMAAGALVFDVSVPEGFEQLLASHRLIMAAEAAAWHRDRFRQHSDDYLPCVASLIEDGLAASATDYLAAKEHQRVMTSRMQQLLTGELDALATPAAIGPAPDSSTTGDPSMNAPWSFTGMPTVSFPISLSPQGLPLAIQLAGLRGTDRLLLDTAAWCEDAIRAAAVN